MEKRPHAPAFVIWANVLTKTLLRSGVTLAGFGQPMYLLTVRGRKSGEPRTTPISVIEHDGRRYLMAPYGAVDWVRNLRAAGLATLTRGRRAEDVRATELPVEEAGLIIKYLADSGNPMSRFFGVSKGASREDLARSASTHPVFSVERVASLAPERVG